MLCDIWSSDQVDTSLQCLCMMVIRNLCCYPPTKPTVASNGTFIIIIINAYYCVCIMYIVQVSCVFFWFRKDIDCSHVISQVT